MAKNKIRTYFIVGDLIASALTWGLFFVYRKVFIETVKFGVVVPVHPDFKFLTGLILMPLFWFLLFYSSGAYSDIRRLQPGRAWFNLILPTIIGSSVIFFLLLLDDIVISYHTYYRSFAVLLILQFFTVALFRTIILCIKNNNFRKNLDNFKVVITGEKDVINKFIGDNGTWLRTNHFEIAGCFYREDERSPGGAGLDDLIKSATAEEVFVLEDPRDKHHLGKVLLKLYQHDVYIRILPEVFHSLNIPLKLNGIFNSPLLMLSKDVIPAWQKSVKTFLDIILSVGAIIILTPLIVFLAVAIKLSSSGPLIYSHVRIGKNGKPFRILKFRSMYHNSEPHGPQLATQNDNRITSVGRFMRKRRLDEIPNLINVLRGEMSLVGPRPERKFYIDQILEKAPEYAKLHLVKPGITSWGQVNFGYAENVDKMISRMKYDLVYIENMSLFADLQILTRTIGTIVKGQGV